MNIVESVQTSTPYIGGTVMSIIGFFLLFELVAFGAIYVYSYFNSERSFMEVLRLSLILTFVELPKGIYTGIVSVINSIKELMT